MTTFPGSPRLLKGAIVGLDPFNPLASMIVLQYNSDMLTSTLTAQTTGGEADQGEALRLMGPPQETIKLDVEIDAADQLKYLDQQIHVRLVHQVHGGMIYTIEENRSSNVQGFSYARSRMDKLFGFGHVPD